MTETIDWRQELLNHKEPLWILAAATQKDAAPLSPLQELIDWYNNYQFTHSWFAGKISFQWGEKTLVPTTGLLPVPRVLLLGLGTASELNGTHGKKFAQDVGRILDDLQVSNPWIILPQSAPDSFVEEMKKSRTSLARLVQATISVA